MSRRAIGWAIVALLWAAVAAIFVAETPSHRRWMAVATAHQYRSTLLPLVVGLIAAAFAAGLGVVRGRARWMPTAVAAVAAIAPLAILARGAVSAGRDGNDALVLACVVMAGACLGGVVALLGRDRLMVAALSLPLAFALGATCDWAVTAIDGIGATEVEPR